MADGCRVYCYVCNSCKSRCCKHLLTWLQIHFQPTRASSLRLNILWGLPTPETFVVMESEWELSHPVLAIGNHKDCHFKFNKHELRCKCYKRSKVKTLCPFKWSRRPSQYSIYWTLNGVYILGTQSNLICNPYSYCCPFLTRSLACYHSKTSVSDSVAEATTTLTSLGRI